jgi:hypothetical protein
MDCNRTVFDTNVTIWVETITVNCIVEKKT